MAADNLDRKTRWYVRDRFGLIPFLIGIAILAFVIATEGEGTAWLLWIAVPLIMMGLGYFLVVNLVRYFLM